MSITDRTAEEVDNSPEVDTRDYSDGRVTFYEVGDSGRWIEISEQDTIDMEDMR